MNLYSQAAPMLEEDPQEQKKQAIPPHKFWRVKWEDLQHRVLLLTHDYWYIKAGPVIRLSPQAAVLGPICHSQEWAEQQMEKALSDFEHHKTFQREVVKTDEKGRPL